jgi:hypothetical protein
LKSNFFEKTLFPPFCVSFFPIFLLSQFYLNFLNPSFFVSINCYFSSNLLLLFLRNFTLFFFPFRSITSRFVVDDSFFVLGLLCYRWLSFHSRESSLLRVFTCFLLIVTFFSLGCVYMCSFLPCTFDGSFPSLIFIYKIFLFLWFPQGRAVSLS